MKRFFALVMLLLVMALLCGSIYHADAIRSWFAKTENTTEPADEATDEPADEPNEATDEPVATATATPAATTEPTPAPTATATPVPAPTVPAASTAPTATPAPTQEPTATTATATQEPAELTFSVTDEFVNVFAELPDISLVQAVQLAEKDGVIYNVVYDGDPRIVCRLADDKRITVGECTTVTLPVNNGKLVTRKGTDACTKNAGEMHLPGFEKAKRAVANSSTWSYEAQYHWFGEMPAKDVSEVFALVQLEDGRQAIALVVYGSNGGNGGGNTDPDPTPTPTTNNNTAHTGKEGGTSDFAGNGYSEEQAARQSAEDIASNGEVKGEKVEEAKAKDIWSKAGEGTKPKPTPTPKSNTGHSSKAGNGEF